MTSPDPRTIPAHPFLAGDLNTTVGMMDALNHCSDVLHMLAELFTAPAEHHSVLDNDRSRNGVFLQCIGIADVLNAISDALANPDPTNN